MKADWFSFCLKVMIFNFLNIFICSMFPTLFKIYIHQILKEWNNSCRGMGISVGKELVHSLLFANDQVIMAQCREDVKFMVRKLLGAFEAGGLKVNMSKTEYLVM